MADYGSRGMNGDVRIDDMPIDDMPKNPSPMLELGTTGVKRAGGYVDEEFLPALRGRKAIAVYREMSLNDPMVGAMLFAIDKLVRQVSWRVETPDNTQDSTKASDFVESCMDDMSCTWADTISEILSMLVYGFSWHEIVYKKRVGPWEKDPRKKSKYNDNLIGWRKIPIRAQETLQRWVFDETGGVQGFVQLAPPFYKTVVLPINKSLLFRTGQHKGNPEGQSIIRTAYRPWYFKKRLEEFEAIGVERDLAGLPVAKVPSHYMNARPDSPEHKTYQAFKKMVQNVRRDEHEGLVLPLEYDPQTKNALFEFELLSSGGSRVFDTNALIQRYEQRILMSTMADFLLLGHEGQGSYAMHVDKTGIFKAAMNVIVEVIADVFNRHAIPRLFALNAWKLDELPRLVPNNVNPPNLAELGQFMGSMGNLGMQFFPDPELEKFLRDVAQLPELPDDVVEMQRQMAMQNQVMQYAESNMMAQGAQQKADAVERGEMTPEQAQMASEQPTPEMAEEQSALEQKTALATKGDPVGEHAAQAQVDEERAAGDHKRTLELKDREAKDGKDADTRAERMKAQEDQRKLALERLKAQAKGKPDTSKMQRVKSSQLRRKGKP